MPGAGCFCFSFFGMVKGWENYIKMNKLIDVLLDFYCYLLESVLDSLNCGDISFYEFKN